jgi:hypothetical protein
MIKRQIITFLILITVFVSKAQDNPETFLKENKLNGPVKTYVINKFNHHCRIEFREFNTKGQLTETRYFGSGRDTIKDTINGEIISFPFYKNPFYRGLDTNELELYLKDYYSYNDKGKIISEKRSNKNDSCINITKYVYNALDSLIEEVYINFEKADTNRYYYVYEYGKNKVQKLKIEDFKDTISKTLTYFDRHSGTSKNYQYHNRKGEDKNSIYHIEMTEYDKHNLLIKEENYSYDSLTATKTPHRIFEYKYNRKRQRVYSKVTNYDWGNWSEESKNYYFFRHGINYKRTGTETKKAYDGSIVNSTYIILLDKCENDTLFKYTQGEKITITTEDYIYDKYNNWTYRKEIYKSQDKDIEEILERNFTYWE